MQQLLTEYVQWRATIDVETGMFLNQKDKEYTLGFIGSAQVFWKELLTVRNMKNIVEQIEQEYRNAKGYGVTFSIDPEAYKCNIPESRLTFSENTQAMQCGTLYNWQDIILDGEVIGYLEERMTGRFLHPMTFSFVVVLADCSEPEKITDEMRSDPHFFEGETYEMQFATLQQLIDYLKLK